MYSLFDPTFMFNLVLQERDTFTVIDKKKSLSEETDHLADIKDKQDL